jgi:hypothetical protein
MAKDDSPTLGGRLAASDLWALLGLLAVAALLWEWNVLRAGETLFSLPNFDLYSEFYPRHSFAGKALRDGTLPLWDPHQIGGLPFLATWQGGVLYPPNWLYAVLPIGTAMGFIGLVHIAAAGSFSYLLCREFGRSRIAAWLGALVFMVGGSTLFMSFHTNAINSVPWLPAAIYCCARLARDEDLRWSILLGLCVALQFLAGREFTFVMTVHTIGLFVAFQLVWMRRDGRAFGDLARHLGRLAVAAGLAAAIAAPQALSTLVLSAESGRTLAGLEGELLEIYNPMSPAFFLANLVNPARGAIRREYFGWIPLVCFVLGFRLWGRDRPVVFASLLSLLSLLLCFGSSTPLYALYRVLPLGSSFRLPDRFVFLFSFGLALTAAAGLDRLLGPSTNFRIRLRSLAPRCALLLAAGAALPLVLGSAWLEAGLASAAEPWGWFAFYGFEKNHFAAISRAGGYFAAAVALLSTAAWAGATPGGRALGVAVLLFAVLDLGTAQRNSFLHPAAEPAPAHAGAACYAKVAAIAGPYGRHLGFRLPSSYAIKDKDGELFARYSVTHYDPLVTRRQAAWFAALEAGGTAFFQSPWTSRSKFMGFLSGTPAPERMRLLDLMGTRVLLADARKKLRPPALNRLLRDYPRRDTCEVGDGDARIPVALYANPNALPRAFVVHRVHSETTPEAAIRRVLEADFDPRREAVVEGEAPTLSPQRAASDATAEIVTYEPMHVTVRVETEAAGLLVLSDSFDRGWVADRDGEKVAILATNGLFRGVVVPAGRSEVVFRYRPREFFWGTGFGAVGLVTAALLWHGTGAAKRRRVCEAPAGSTHSQNAA